MVLFNAESSSGSFDFLEQTLREALVREEFVLHYQPYRDLTTHEVSGVEALVRWQRPGYGLIYPDHFISCAERSNLIEALGDWVLRTACAQMSRWQEMGIDVPSISVNVSPRQFNNSSFTTLVETILAATNLSIEKLDLEITESAVATDEKNMLESVDSLRKLGVKISIDDFGMGYSSLSRLQRMQVDRIKIDRSFVSELTLNTKDACLVRSMIHLAKQLGLNVIAEGIEDQETRAILQAMGCDQGQGYYFSKALKAIDCENYLRTTQQQHSVDFA